MYCTVFHQYFMTAESSPNVQGIGVGTRGARCAIAPPLFLLTIDLEMTVNMHILVKCNLFYIC